MIKKIKSAVIMLTAALALGSCTIAHTAIVTNNPVGTKKAEMKTSIGKNQGVSFHQAMKMGKITKIGIAEYKLKVIVIIPSQRLTITGE